MRTFYVALIAFIFLTTGCSANSSVISGTVVDSETGEPINGAVVLVEWTKTKGFGLTYTVSYKVEEATTDKQGKFSVSKVSSLFAEHHLTIYKKGYVVWNNQFIFPDYKKRTDFEWGKSDTFRLSHFKPEYSYDKHVDFIEHCIAASQNLENKQTIYGAFAWERDLAMQERMKKGLSP